MHEKLPAALLGGQRIAVPGAMAMSAPWMAGLGGAGALSLGALGVSEVNDELVDRAPADLLAALMRNSDPRVAALAARERQRLARGAGGLAELVGGRPRAPVEDTNRFNPTAHLRAAEGADPFAGGGTAANPLGPAAAAAARMRGGVGGGGGGTVNLDDQVGSLKALLAAHAANQQGIAEKNAQAGFKMLDERKQANLEDAYKELVAKNKRTPVDPLSASNEGGSAPAFRALASIGPGLLGSGNIAQGLANFGAALDKNWTAEETRSAEERKQALTEGLTGLGLRKEDLAAVNEAAKERLAMQQALNQSGGLATGALVTGAEKGLDIEKAKAEMVNKLRVANAAHAPKQTLTQGAIEYAEAMRNAGDERPQPVLQKEFLTRGREARPAVTTADQLKLAEAFQNSGLPESERRSFMRYLTGDAAPDVLDDYGRRIEAYRKTKNPAVFTAPRSN